MLLKNEFIFMKKSKIKAGEGKKDGKYPFFTSSDTKILFLDDYLFDDEAVVLGTGGMPSCNYYNGKFSVSTDNFVLKSKGCFLAKTLYYFLRNNNLSLLERGFHGAGLKHIGKDYLENIELPSISQEKQRTIIKELDSIVLAIRQVEKNLSQQDELIKSRFIEMFGDCKTKKPLEELTTKITDGSHNPPKGIEKSEFLMLSSQNVHNELDLTDVRYLTKEDFEIENKRTDVQKGDVLLTIVGTIGRTHVVKENEKYTFQRSVGVIKPKNNILNGTFLSTYLHTEEAIDQLESGGHGSSQKGIYLKDIDKSKFICFI